jgi:hypothetical protein
MAFSEQNQDITRRYLLGQLTDDEEQSIEERLLVDDELFQELELAKDELTQEYVNQQLTETESDLFQHRFLRSPEAKQKYEFAKTFAAYAQRRAKPEKFGLIERLRSFFSVQPKWLSAAAMITLVVIVGVIFWLARTSPPQTVATLTLVSSPATRSGDVGSLPSVRLKEDVLKLVLTPPQAVSPAARYRVELLDDKGTTTTLAARAQDTQSVVVEIDAAQLRRGQYAVTLSTVADGGAVNRIPGIYYFAVE